MRYRGVLNKQKLPKMAPNIGKLPQIWPNIRHIWHILTKTRTDCPKCTKFVAYIVNLDSLRYVSEPMRLAPPEAGGTDDYHIRAYYYYSMLEPPKDTDLIKIVDTTS